MGTLNFWGYLEPLSGPSFPLTRNERHGPRPRAPSRVSGHVSGGAWSLWAQVDLERFFQYRSISNRLRELKDGNAFNCYK